MGTIGASSTANGGTITSGVLSLAPADGTNGGIVTSSAQTFGGKKTFADSAVAKGLRATDSVITKGLRATGTATASKLVINVPTTGAQGLDLSTSNGYANVRVLQNSNSSLDKDIYLGFESGATSSLHLYSNNTEAMSVTGGKVYVTSNVIAGGSLISLNPTNAAINATATATAANIISGYITSTSAAATTITLPTASDIASTLYGSSVARGTQLEFIVDNASGSNTVTIALGTGITAQTTAAITGSTTLTVTTANKIARFRLIFTSATTAVIVRVF
jgi:hypothetical protein